MASAEDDVLARAGLWQVAIEARDVAAADAVLDEDFALELVEPSRAVVARDAWLGMLPSYVVHAYEVHERIIDVAGDLAVVLQRVTMSATVGAADRSGVFVLTDVWRRIDGAWRVWRRHSTPLDAGELS